MFSQISTSLSRYFSFYPPDRHLAPSRRNDLDWLRIILFGLLIIHHVGMFYVSNWGWHAKSQYRAEWLESILLIVEPWRMPAIWLISGVAIRFLLAKVSILRFVSLRSLRLLLPLLIGVLVVVPPQLFIEMTAKGEIAMSYWQFMGHFFSSYSDIFENYQYGIWPHIDVNHLWYLRSLWFYSLYLVLLLPLLNSVWVTWAIDWLSNRHGLFLILLMIAIVLVIQLNWEMNRTRYPIGFTFLLLGYLLGWHQGLWQKLSSSLKPLAVSFLLGSAIFITLYNVVWLDVIKGQTQSEAMQLITMVAYSTMRIIGVALVLSLTYRFLNKRSKHLGYFSDAVYPFYIFHQSLILVIGYYLTQLNLGPVVEGVAVTLSTILGCWILFEVVRRVELLRPCFGLKMKGQYSRKMMQFGYTMGFLLVSPLAMRLLF